MAAHCSPKNHKFSKTGTCYSKQELEVIARKYNEAASAKGFQPIQLSTQKKVLHKRIAEKLEPICSYREDCWATQEFMDHDTRRTLQEAFRPYKPVEWYSNKREWLSNFDILYVMNQYEHKYPNFEFLGVYPIDFAEYYPRSNICIGGNDMCNFDVRKLASKGKTRFAMVLNLDTHDMSGSHWVAIYADINPRSKNYGIFYYDSVANSVGHRTKKFMKQMVEQVKRYYPRRKREFKDHYNRIQKQFKNTECGMFSMVFLTQCLKEIPFQLICKYMKKDDDMNKFRDSLYTPRLDKTV
jgi:hypothetical protein